MATVRLQVRISSIPVGFCFTDWQTSFPQLVELQYVEGEVEANLHIGEAPPTNTAFAWDRLISGVPDRRYHFSSGVWVSKHQMPVGFTMLAPAGSTRDTIAGLDGGDGDPDEPALAFTGPMWEIDTDFSALFPIGPGTLQSGEIINEGDAAGQEKVALKLEEMPPHHHVLLVSQSDTEGGTGIQRLRPNATESDSDANSASTGGDATTGLVVPHSNMPPWRSRFFMKRTARTHHRA